MTRTTRNLWMLSGAAALVMLCYVFSTLLIYLVISVVVGFVGDPLVNWMRRRKIGRMQLPGWLAAFLTLSLFAALMIGLVALFVPLVIQEIQVISSLNPDHVVSSFQVRLHSFSAWLDNLGLGFSADDLYRSLIQEVTGALSLRDVTGAANSLLTGLGNAVAGFFSVLFMSFFFLRDGSLFYKMVFTMTPQHYMEKVKNILSHSHRMLSRYFAGLLVQVVLIMVMVGAGLSVFGVRNALLIAVFAGLANVIPYIGPLISAIFALVVAITTGLAADSTLAILPLSIKIIGVFAGVQFIDNWILQPLVLGTSVKVHPLELFIVFLAAATLGGVLGMALALPVYTILRITAREFFQEFKVVESLTRDIGN